MPPDTPPLDLPAAHRHFSADCFNRAWAYIDKSGRSADDDEQMVLLALASLWHWTQREDRTDQNLSVGHWQVSRACALAGQGEYAMRHAERCLERAKGSPPFYVGYAHEALARAALVVGDHGRFRQHLAAARTLAASVAAPDERRLLEQDLDALAAQA